MIESSRTYPVSASTHTSLHVSKGRIAAACTGVMLGNFRSSVNALDTDGCNLVPRISLHGPAVAMSATEDQISSACNDSQKIDRLGRLAQDTSFFQPKMAKTHSQAKMEESSTRRQRDYLGHPTVFRLQFCLLRSSIFVRFYGIRGMLTAHFFAIF